MAGPDYYANGNMNEYTADHGSAGSAYNTTLVVFKAKTLHPFAK
jgi:hypothetical protein